MKCWRVLPALLLFVLQWQSAQSNDIKVSNVSSYLFEASIPTIQFDLSWENSWRSNGPPAMYDAAWVFVKYKDNFGTWRHLKLNGSHNNPTGYTIADTNDNLGVFIYRSTIGTGSVSISGIELGAEPVPGFYEIKVYAIEMVYVPQIGFSVGDGNGTSFSQGSLMKQDNNLPVGIGPSAAVKVTSQGGIDDEILNTQGITIHGDFGLDTNNDGTYENPGYPIGYKAFYCMKYEVSMRGIFDFLNTLTFEQQDFLETNPAGESSPGIGDIMLEVQGVGGADPVPAIFGVDTDGDGNWNETEDNETGAASGLRWKVLAAYLDWAALRPMTELEFEKVSRGTAAPLLNEYVWGTTVVNSAAHTIVNAKSSTEAASGGNVNGNANYKDQQQGTLRCGIFADATTNRKSSGAAYYGAMDMGGNASEIVVSLGNVAGRSFTGKLGNGEVTVHGFADEDNWPGIDGNDDPNVPNGTAVTTGVNKSAGIGLRGGDFGDDAALLQLSNREHATNMDLMVIGRGGRGVRQVD